MESLPASRISGELITESLDGGKKIIQPTVSCVHCQRTWVWQPGSGRTRGFCFRCDGFVCGPNCAGACVPWDQMLSNIEQNRPLDYRPIIVAGGWHGQDSHRALHERPDSNDTGGPLSLD